MVWGAEEEVLDLVVDDPAAVAGEGGLEGGVLGHGPDGEGAVGGFSRVRVCGWLGFWEEGDDCWSSLCRRHSPMILGGVFCSLGER